MLFTNDKNMTELEPQLRSIIYSNGKKLIYKKGDTIVKAGEILEYVYYLENGSVRYTILCEDGTNQIIASISNTLIGTAPILNGIYRPFSDVFSETKSEVYAIKINTFFSLIDSSKVFRYYVLKDLAKTTSTEIQRGSKFRLYTKKDLFFSFLIENINSKNLIDGTWYKLDVYYTQQELADFLGVSRITISTIIKKLCEEGKIRLINHELQVRICDENSGKFRLI